MENKQVTRRRFVGDSAKVATGMTAGSGAAANQTVRADDREKVDTSKILNYNENMEYRRQGSTDWMVSAVCLGGHSRSAQK